ncbi:MAG: EAL domain-containing protein [Eubacteriales bacterium]|nr:EAL domain-containing protein [Eubacteriales bacterium]
MKLARERVVSIEKKMTIPLWIFLAVVLITGTVVVLSLGTHIGNDIKRNTKDAVVKVCKKNVELVDNKVMGRQKALRALALRLSPFDKDNIKSTIESLKQEQEIFEYYNMALFGENGKGYTTLGESLDLSGEDYIQRALQGEEIVTESKLSEDGKEYLNIFVTPIKNEEKVEGVLTATYRSSDFLDLMNTGVLEEKGQSIVMDANGRAVSLPEKEADSYRLAKYISDSVIIGYSSTEGFEHFYYNGKKYLAYVVPMQCNDWHMITYVPADVVYNDVIKIQKSIVGVLAIMYLCIILLVIVCGVTYRRLSDRIALLAFQDDVTGGRNYEYLKIYYENTSKEEMKKKYLVVFDIDRFKFINMLYGVEEGDRLLTFILRTFQDILPEEQIFKNTADIFIAIIKGEEEDEVSRKIERLNRELTERAKREDMSIFTLSYGICRMDTTGDLRSVYDNAMLAKKEAKAGTGKKYIFFNSVQRKKIRLKEMEDAFDEALKEGEFKVWYQPKYDMRTETICGAEALVRWQKPDGTVISPGDFIPFLEENRKITELDDEVLRIVCADLKKLEAEAIDPGIISVNLSKIHLERKHIVEDIVKIVEDADVMPQKLAFEITESALYENRERLDEVIQQLQSKGFLVEMDDYGTGSSTLQSLSRTNFNTLKLDKSFVDNIGTEKVDIILKSTIQLAKHLSMGLVAEGVEEREQVEFLVENGCHVAQGYYFSKPLEKERYFHALRREKIKNSMER